MSQGTRQYRREIEKMLERNWNDWTITVTKSRFKITLRRGNRTRMAFTALTPSCTRAIKNFERDVKREIAILKQEVSA